MLKAKLTKKFEQVTNEFIGIKEFEKKLIGYHLIWSNSFEDYVLNKPVSKSKRLGWYMVTSFMVINTFKYGTLFLYHEPWLLALLGEFSYVHYKIEMMAFFGFTAGLLELGRICTYHYLETTRRFKMLEVFHHIITSNRVEGMSKSLEKKYSRNFYFFSKFVEHQVAFFTSMIILWCVTMMHHAYYDDQIQHNLVSLLLGGLTLTLFSRQVIILGTCTSAMFTMTLMYMKFRFIIVLQYIRVCVRSQSNVNKAVRKHKEFADMLRATSSFVNLTIGLVYYVSPVIIVIPIQIAIDQDIALWKRAVMANFFVLIGVTEYLVSRMSTWIPKNNATIPKMLYKLPFKLQPRSFGVMFELDEFISTLNTTFLGLYAFNVFKFTKLTFYQFLFGTSVTYMMIEKRINE